MTADAGNTLGGTLTMGAVSESATTEPGTVGWTYEVANSATQYLAAGETATEKFTVTIDDGHGGTVSQAVTMTITGTNDGPDIRVNAGDSGGETIAEANSGLSATGTLTVTDVDTLDTVSSAVTGVALSGTAGSLVAADVLSMLSLSTTSALTANTGEAHNLGWTFNSGSQAFNYLAAGEHLTLTYTVTSTDNHSTSDTQTVTINITGTNDNGLDRGGRTPPHRRVAGQTTAIDDGTVDHAERRRQLTSTSTAPTASMPLCAYRHLQRHDGVRPQRSTAGHHRPPRH